MANPRPKKPSTVFKKGQSGNPKGSSKKMQLYGDIAKMSHEHIAAVGAELLSEGIAGMQAILKDPNSSTLKAWTAALVIKSMAKGDSAAYERILNRIVGKPKETIELSGPNQGPIQTANVEDLKAQLAAIRAQSEELGDD